LIVIAAFFRLLLISISKGRDTNGAIKSGIMEENKRAMAKNMKYWVNKSIIPETDQHHWYRYQAKRIMGTKERAGGEKTAATIKAVIT